MSKDEITRKSIFMSSIKSKIGYPFVFKDLEEIEEIIDFYEAKEARLIKYLESLLTDKKEINHFIVTGVEDLLERIKRGKYD